MRGTTHGAPVFLCGMMGSGKSTVGRALAERMDCRFVDLDRRIERVWGRSIPQLFSERGEAGFREAESLALETLLSEPAFAARSVVVATGGGAVIRAEHRAWIRASGRGVFLDVPLEELVQRLSTPEARGSRPLLKDETGDGSGEGPRPDRGAVDALRERLGAVWAVREPMYRELELCVDGRGSPQDVVVTILSALDPVRQTGETASVGVESERRDP